MFDATVTTLTEAGLQRTDAMLRNPPGFSVGATMVGIFVRHG